MSGPHVKTYDCRLGQDFRLADSSYGLQFSSLESGFTVLDDAGCIPWTESAAALATAVRATSTFGFMTVLPWWPGGRDVLAAVRQQFGPGVEGKDSMCVIFEPTLANLSQALDLRERAGGAGEWGIGGCTKPLEMYIPVGSGDKQTCLWDLTAVLLRAGVVGSCLYLGEHHSAIFMTRMFDGIDQVLESLVGSIKDKTNG